MTNSAYSNEIPSNTSLLQPTKYLFSIPDLPFARYFLQSVNLPSVSGNYVSYPTPFVDLKLHGDKAIFAPITMTVLVDEDLRVWEETFNWLVSYLFPQGFEQYKHRGGKPHTPIYYDGVLTTLNNANRENLRMHFKTLHPLSMSDLILDTRGGTESLTVNLTFAYDYYTLERISD